MMETLSMETGEWSLNGQRWTLGFEEEHERTLRELLGETSGQLALNISPKTANANAADNISEIADLLDWASSPGSALGSPDRVPDLDIMADDAKLDWEDIGGDLFTDWIDEKVDLPLLDEESIEDNLPLLEDPSPKGVREVVMISTPPSSPECVVPEELSPPWTVSTVFTDECSTPASSDVGSYISQPSSPEEIHAGGGPIRIRVSRRKSSDGVKKPYLEDEDYVAEDEEDEDEMPESPQAKGRRRGPKAARGDRRSRKRDQNKNAANKYRRKKKEEVEKVSLEEEEVMKTNKRLRDKVAELSKEAKYLKNLMREVLKAKGVLK